MIKNKPNNPPKMTAWNWIRFWVKMTAIYIYIAIMFWFLSDYYSIDTAIGLYLLWIGIWSGIMWVVDHEGAA